MIGVHFDFCNFYLHCLYCVVGKKYRTIREKKRDSRIAMNYCLWLVFFLVGSATNHYFRPNFSKNMRVTRNSQRGFCRRKIHIPQIIQLCTCTGPVTKLRTSMFGFFFVHRLHFLRPPAVPTARTQSLGALVLKAHPGERRGATRCLSPQFPARSKPTGLLDWLEDRGRHLLSKLQATPVYDPASSRGEPVQGYSRRRERGFLPPTNNLFP